MVREKGLEPPRIAAQDPKSTLYLSFIKFNYKLFKYFSYIRIFFTFLIFFYY